MAPTTALERLLDDLVTEIAEMPPEVYTARPLSAVSGSIGEHVRHVLDHVAAFLRARYSAVLSYDNRERGTSIETSPEAAIGQIFRLKHTLDQFAMRDLEEPVQVTSKVSPDHAIDGWSTLSRELAFVVSHTIHHQAMIAVLASIHGLAVSDRFGYAPTTPRA